MLLPIVELIEQVKISINTITAAEAAIKCKNEQGIMIDAREPVEYDKKAGLSTINIPRGLLEMKMLQNYKNENLAIFIHCASGARAILAAEQLERIGYKNVWAITCTLEEVCLVC